MGIVVKDGTIQIERLVVGPYETNAYVVTCVKTRARVLVDAPAGKPEILESLKDHPPEKILVTHSHIDHVGALAGLRARWNAPVCIHPLDARGLAPPPEMPLRGGETISFGEIGLAVFHTPGHTPGSLCFLAGKHLLSGDTIFPGGPGRTNSPADLKRIIRSIRDEIFVLADDTVIYPGHGEATVVKKEKAAFAAFSSRPHAPGLCGDVLWLSS